MKNHQTLLMSFAAALVIAAAVGLAGCSNSNSADSQTSSGGAAKAKVYTCSMHPDVTSDKPGKCPKCGMDLVEKK